MRLIPAHEVSDAMRLCPAKNPVQVGAANRTLALSHPGALVIDMDLTRGLPLRLALHTVELTTVGLRHDFSSLDDSRKTVRGPQSRWQSG